MSDTAIEPGTPTDGTVQGPCADGELFYGLTCGCGGSAKRPICRPIGSNAPLTVGSTIPVPPPPAQTVSTSYRVVFPDGTEQTYLGRELMKLQQRCSSGKCAEKWLIVTVTDAAGVETVTERRMP